MKNIYHRFYILSLVFFVVFWANGNAQYSILETAEQTEISLRASNTGTGNRSSIAFNPLKRVYYSVNAGSENYYVDSYNEDGQLVDSTVSGFDFRGAWWNTLLYSFEGNGFNSLGIFTKIIDPFSGFATSGGSVVLANTQPDAQSIGDLDTAKYEIIYYSSGTIYRYSRLNDQLMGSAVLSGLPGGTELNSNSVFYTGIDGMEYGVFDFANLRLIFLNRLSEYMGYSQLPETTSPVSIFKASWANRLLWIFNTDSSKWFSYKVFEGFPVNVKEGALNESGNIRVFPNPVTSETKVNFENLSSEVSHIRLLNLNGKVVKDFTNIQTPEQIINLQGESAGIYILQISTVDGKVWYKKLIKQ